MLHFLEQKNFPLFLCTFPTIHMHHRRKVRDRRKVWLKHFELYNHGHRRTKLRYIIASSKENKGSIGTKSLTLHTLWFKSLCSIMTWGNSRFEKLWTRVNSWDFFLLFFPFFFLPQARILLSTLDWVLYIFFSLSNLINWSGSLSNVFSLWNKFIMSCVLVEVGNRFKAW